MFLMGIVWGMLMSWEQLWCNAFDNERTISIVEERQLIVMPKGIHNGWLSDADVVIRGDRCDKVTSCLRGRLFTMWCTYHPWSTALQKNVLMLGAKEPHRQSQILLYFSHSCTCQITLIESSFFCAFLHRVKQGLIMPQAKSKECPCFGNIHHLPLQKNSKQHNQ